jgi:hypothetical protein
MHGDGHIVAAVPDLGAASPLCRDHNLGSELAIRVRNRALRVAIVRLLLGTSSVLNVMVVALLTLHDAMDGAWRFVLTVIVQMTSQLPLLTLAMALIDVAARVAGMPVLFEVSAEVTISCTIRLRLVGIVLVDFFLDGGESVVRRLIRLTARMPA